MAKILVIRHGALGDMITCAGAFAAIRKHHANDEITLLTNSAFVNLAKSMGYFDQIHVDDRLPLWRLDVAFRLRKWFRKQNFSMVYDLQNSNRTSTYYKFFGPKMPNWSGIADGCSHPQPKDYRLEMHNYDRLADQLRIAGIPETPLPSVEWMKGDISTLELPEKFAMLVPGCAKGGEFKRWPAKNFAELATWFECRGIKPVIIGGPDDVECVEELLRYEPRAISLLGKTKFFDIAEVARKAVITVANDTGPMHIAALTRKPTLILFSGSHNSAIVAPKLPSTKWIECKPITDLSIEKVIESVTQMIA